MRYFIGSNLDVIGELVEEINDGLEIISDEVDFLETLDWDEIFEHVPSGDGVKRNIIDSLDAIKTVLDNISK